MSNDTQEVVQTKPKKKTAKASVPSVQTSVQTNPNALVELAITKGADVEALERVFALQERWQANQAKSAFTQAMANLKTELPVVKKLVEGHNYKYAPLEDIANQVDKVISKHGFTYRWDTTLSEKAMTVVCTATHIEGHQETSSFTAPIISGTKSMNEVQSSAATITYLKRYTLCNLFGIMIAGEDQDARIKSMQPKLPASPKAKIMSLLKALDVDTSDGEVIKEQVKKMTGDALVEKNFDEIISKLTILWQEKQETNEN